MNDPEYYKNELGIVRSIPSPETLCQQMDDIDSRLRQQILAANLNLSTTHNAAPTALSSDGLWRRRQVELWILIEDGSWFIAKRNLRRGETKDVWLKMSRYAARIFANPAAGKTSTSASWKGIEYIIDD